MPEQGSHSPLLAVLHLADVLVNKEENEATLAVRAPLRGPQVRIFAWVTSQEITEWSCVQVLEQVQKSSCR